MNWLLPACACAVSTATAAAISKLLLRTRNELFVGWVRFLFVLPVFAFLFWAQRPEFCLSAAFWKTIAVMLPLELAAFLLYLNALKVSPLSLTFPFLGLTPVFTILTAFLFLNETISLPGAAGVALVTVGAYVLNADTAKYGFWEPLKRIYKERGSRFMVLVALIFGVTSTLGKRALLLSDPFLFPLIYYSIFFAILTPIALVKKGITFRLNKKEVFLCVGLGLVFSAAIYFHFAALSMVKVPYFMSVKRLSLVISMIYAYTVFKERQIGWRFLGSLVITVGVILLALAG